MICLVTDRTRFDVLDTVAAAAAEGVDLVQVRERGLHDRALLELVRGVLDRVRGAATRAVAGTMLVRSMPGPGAGGENEERQEPEGDTRDSTGDNDEAS